MFCIFVIWCIYKKEAFIITFRSVGLHLNCVLYLSDRSDNNWRFNKKHRSIWPDSSSECFFGLIISFSTVDLLEIDTDITISGHGSLLPAPTRSRKKNYFLNKKKRFLFWYLWKCLKFIISCLNINKNTSDLKRFKSKWF